MAYIGRRMRHVCSMKGCRNREVFLVSKNGELGGGLYLCEECMRGMKKYIDLFDAEKKAKKTESPETPESEKNDALEDEDKFVEKKTSPKKRTVVVPKDEEVNDK